MATTRMLHPREEGRYSQHVTKGTHLGRQWKPGTIAAVPGLSGITCREIETTDASALGQVMWSAFKDTVDDDEYETISDAENEVLQTVQGKWGPLVPYGSLLASTGQEIVSAAFVVFDQAHEFRPLLAFAVTVPEHQGKGIGGWLIENAVAHLDAAGIGELHLAVLPANPARRLYERLGFKEVEAANGDA